jgi:tetratricopeptide (TPR) repeat protein
VDRLTHDHDNIRATLRWSIESDEADVGLMLAGAAWRFWHQRAHFREARTWFDQLLALPSGSVRSAVRAKGLTGLGGIAYWQGDYPAAENAYDEALAIYRELGDEQQIADAVVNSAYMPALRGDNQGTMRRLEEAVKLFDKLGAAEQAAYAKASLGYALMMDGDTTSARPLFEENLAVAERSGNAFVEAGAHHMMGQLERLSGNLAEAAAHYRAAIRLFRGAGDQASMLEPLEAMGSVASAEGNHERAVRLSAAAAAGREVLGGGPPPEWLMPGDVLGDARNALGEEAAEHAATEGAAMILDEAADYALGDE